MLLKVNNTPMDYNEKTLIYDIETDGRDPATATPIMVGWFSSVTGFNLTWRPMDFAYQLATHDIIVGYNNKNFDDKIMERHCGLNYRGKTNIDLWEILAPANRGGKARTNIIAELSLNNLTDNRISNFKLEKVIELLKRMFPSHFSSYKVTNFDYNIFKKSVITPEEKADAERYLFQDILITKELYLFLEYYFKGFRDYMTPYQNTKKLYLTASVASYAYKLVCNKLNLQETYSDIKGPKFIGGKVIEPKKEHYSGDGYCIDFASQHPNHQRCGNTYTPIEKCRHKVDGRCPNPWKGGKVFKLTGTYCGCEQGPTEKLITQLYLLRKHYKRIHDPRQYTIKIVINALYGVSSSPTFVATYNTTTGPDTTAMSRQSLRYMQKWFEKYGYEVFYGDSVAGESIIKSSIFPNGISIEQYYNLMNKQWVSLIDTFKKEYIFINDNILSSDKYGNASFKKSTYIMRHKVLKQMYRIFATNTEYIDVTADHSIMVRTDNSIKEIKPTNLNVGDKLLFYGGNKIHNFNRISDIDSWLYGMWIGDGSYSKDNYIQISSNDFEVEDKIKEYCLKYKCNYSIAKNSYDYKIANTKQTRYMMSLGYIGTSVTKKIPNYVMNGNLNIKANFLNGYFCADGTVLKNGYIRLTSINHKLVLQVQTLLQEFGITSKIIKENNPNSYKGKISNTYSHHLIISKFDNKTFKDNIGFDIKRKHNKITFNKRKDLKFGSFRESRIMNIVKLPKKECYVYDLNVPTTKTFIANNILVHNTDSLFLLDPFKDLTKLQTITTKGVQHIKDALPFADKYYDMEIEYAFSDIYFILTKDSGVGQCKKFAKKNYIIFKNDKTDPILFHGLPIIKNTTSPLAKLVLEKYLLSEMLAGKKISFRKEVIDKMVELEIRNNPDLLAIEYNVDEPKNYKSTTSLQYQIAKKLGPGRHKLIKSFKGDIGVNQKYIRLEDAKNLRYTDYNLFGVYSALMPFILPKDTQIELGGWFKK